MAVPLSLKAINPFVKVANDLRKNHDVVAYYCDLHAMKTGMKIDKSSSEAKKFLINLMTKLEEQKAILTKDPEKNEQVHSDLVGQNLIETQAKKLFTWSDAKDRRGEFEKNVVKAFYTSAILFDVAEGVAEDTTLDAECLLQRKYARWKATYINNCLKNGETPVPGPIGGFEDEFEAELGISEPQDTYQSAGHSSAQTPPTIPHEPPAQPPVATTRAKVYPSNPEPVSQPQPAVNADDEWPPEVFTRAKKLCKFAISSIEYEDVPAALDNLSKCMQLLRTGKEN